jgi:hypothetical protein
MQVEQDLELSLSFDTDGWLVATLPAPGRSVDSQTESPDAIDCEFLLYSHSLRKGGACMSSAQTMLTRIGPREIDNISATKISGRIIGAVKISRQTAPRPLFHGFNPFELQLYCHRHQPAATRIRHGTATASDPPT